jgi:hypothetical protein
MRVHYAHAYAHKAACGASLHRVRATDDRRSVNCLACERTESYGKGLRMKISKKHLQGLATGFQLGGIIVSNLDTDKTGTDDTLGSAFTTAGIACAQLAVSESVSKKGKAADAIDAIAAALSTVSADLRAGG